MNCDCVKVLKIIHCTDKHSTMSGHNCPVLLWLCGYFTWVQTDWKSQGKMGYFCENYGNSKLKELSWKSHGILKNINACMIKRKLVLILLPKKML